MAQIINKISKQKLLHISAETVCAELLLNGIESNILNTTKLGAFKKRYSQDVEKIMIDNNGDTEQQLHIQINRNSIYDKIPQGLFHQTANIADEKSAAKMGASSRKLRKEEKLARQFFQPFDHEFLMASTMVEQKERLVLQQYLNANVSEDPYQFWGIPKYISNHYAAYLSNLFPWAYLIKSNKDLTLKALHLLIENTVSLTVSNPQIQFAKSLYKKLNTQTLGDDSVIGEMYNDLGTTWAFTIANISKENIKDFAPNGHHHKLLCLFTEIFIPLDVDVIFKYELEKTENKANLNEHILGIGFKL